MADSIQQLQQAEKGLADVRRRIDELQEAYSKAYYTTDQFANAQKALNRELKAAEKAVATHERVVASTQVSVATTTQAQGYLAGSTRNSAMAFLQLSQTVEDAQYGLRGIMNNIPGLVMSLGGGVGLAGAASIALVGVAQLTEHWDDLTRAFGASKVETEAERMERLAKATQKTKEEAQELAAWQEKQDARKAIDKAGDVGMRSRAETVSAFVGSGGGPAVEARVAEALAKEMPDTPYHRQKAKDDAALILQRAQAKSGTLAEQERAQRILGDEGLGVVDFTGIGGSMRRDAGAAAQDRARREWNQNQEAAEEAAAKKKERDRRINAGMDKWFFGEAAALDQNFADANVRTRAELAAIEEKRQQRRYLGDNKARMQADRLAGMVPAIQEELAALQAQGFTEAQSAEIASAKARRLMKASGVPYSAVEMSAAAGALVTRAGQANEMMGLENSNQATNENTAATEMLTRQIEEMRRNGIRARWSN